MSDNNSDTMSDTGSEISDQDNIISDDELNTEDVINNDEIDINDIIIKEVETEIGITPDDKRISKNIMTKFEMIRIIGEREKQITMGAKPLIKQNEKSENLSYKEIAIEELKMNMTPLKIKRLVNGNYEIWKVNELRKNHLLHILN